MDPFSALLSRAQQEGASPAVLEIMRMLLVCGCPQDSVVPDDDEVPDFLFGTAALGNVVLDGPVAGFSGILDYESLVVNADAILTPAPNVIPIVRARESITWNGTYSGDGSFDSFSGLIQIGSDVSSGPGGGGGGGSSGFNSGQQGQQNFNGGGGGSQGYTQPVPGVPGMGGMGGNPGPGSPGGDGTVGVVGTVLAGFLNTFRIFPGVYAALSGGAVGQQGIQGGRGGDGADVGGGHGVGGDGGSAPFRGGNGGSTILLIAPVIIFGSTARFLLRGFDGAAGGVGAAGGNAPPGSNGGGGGGGGGGSGSQGGSGGALIGFYSQTFIDGGATYLVTGGLGGAPGGSGGPLGAGDGVGFAGGPGGAGAAGPSGATGFVLVTKFV
jgi:hypothetical protein